MTTKRRHLPVVQADEVYEENYAFRKAFADETKAQIDAAIAECGEGAEGYAVWKVTDRKGLEPVRVVYTANWGAGWTPPAPHSDERIIDEAQSFEVKGVKFYPMRYSVAFGSFSDYKPRTPEQMKAAAQARHDKVAAQIAEDEREEAARRAIQLELKL